MDTVLRGIPIVICYLDDILITGATEEEHLHSLDQVLQAHGFSQMSIYAGLSGLSGIGNG